MVETTKNEVSVTIIATQKPAYFRKFHTCSSGYGPKLAVAGDDLQSSPFNFGFLILRSRQV